MTAGATNDKPANVDGGVPFFVPLMGNGSESSAMPANGTSGDFGNGHGLNATDLASPSPTPLMQRESSHNDDDARRGARHRRRRRRCDDRAAGGAIDPRVRAFDRS